MAPLTEFVQWLLAEQGFSNLERAVQVELEAELTDQAERFLNRRLVDAMSEAAAERFVALLEGPNANEQAVQDFVAQNVPNMQSVVAAALAEFRVLYLGDKA